MSVLTEKHWLVVGAGNIGRILIERLLHAGVTADRLSVCDADESRVRTLAATYHLAVINPEQLSGCHADVWLIATPPGAVKGVLSGLRETLRAGQVMISFAAGVPLSWLESLVPSGVTVVRVMPNAPSLVGQGLNPVAYGAEVTAESRALVGELLAALGETIEVSDEQMNWCVGLSGAAMRSLLPVLEGMTQAGREAGLSERDARRVAAQVMLGTAKLALETDLSWEQLKALTPMQTVDEAAIAGLFVEAARGARAKVDALQRKLAETGPAG
jgi:pyrroline-5-carboxylate reductase